MVWVESHAELGDHPKLHVLMEALSIEDACAVGMMHYLWWWSAKYATKGSLAKYTPAQIAKAARWKGRNPEEFIEALVKAGFLVRRKGVLALHDWLDYRYHFDSIAEKDEQRRELTKQRVSRHRQRNADVTLSNDSVTKTCNAEQGVNNTKTLKTLTSLTTTSINTTRAQGEALQTDEYLIPEPKQSPADAIIMRYKILKGVPYDHRDWDRKWSGYYRQHAMQLLRDCVTYAKAYACLEHWAGIFQGRGYKDWTLRAVADRAIEWMGAEGGKVHGTSNSERFFAALRKQRGVEETDPGLRKLPGAGALLGSIRDAQTASHGGHRPETRNGNNGHVGAVGSVPSSALEGTADRGKKS